ncbi:MAG TPA: hypothetical protein VF691_11800 [Cytophagaceae bacterium]
MDFYGFRPETATSSNQERALANHDRNPMIKGSTTSEVVNNVMAGGRKITMQCI